MVPTLLDNTEEDEPITIHLVAYERSRSLPSSVAGVHRSPSVGGGSSSSSSSQGETSEGQAGVSRQPSLTPVQEAGRDERANPPNQQSQRVVSGVVVKQRYLQVLFWVKHLELA